MGQGQDTPWIRLTGRINTRRGENGQQTQKLEHPSSIQLMGHCLKTMNQVGTHKQTVS
ncbi:PB1-F2 protein [Influenza A virus]